MPSQARTIKPLSFKFLWKSSVLMSESVFCAFSEIFTYFLSNINASQSKICKVL